MGKKCLFYINFKFFNTQLINGSVGAIGYCCPQHSGLNIIENAIALSVINNYRHHTLKIMCTYSTLYYLKFKLIQKFI